MLKLGSREQSLPTTTSGFRTARDASPDSVIFILESNSNFFSSTSASVDRCSFASDAQDRDSITSEISLVIAFLFRYMHLFLTVVDCRLES